MGLPLLFCLHLPTLPSLAWDAELVKAQGTLLFEDEFSRDEATPDKEDIGNGWTPIDHGGFTADSAGDPSRQIPVRLSNDETFGRRSQGNIHTVPRTLSTYRS